jgi:5-hydroxyisourate hydrolase
MSLSTHVLDTAKGTPATGIQVHLETRTPQGWERTGTHHTDADGRIRAWHTEVGDGLHRLVFDTGTYLGEGAFFPEVTVTFRIEDSERQHYHVPLLLSPFGYSTYRGS